MKLSNCLTVFFLLVFSAMQAQIKEYPKLASLFANGKYEECIQMAVKIADKDQKELNPLLYSAKSYFEVFKQTEEKNKFTNLRSSLQFAQKIQKLDKRKAHEALYGKFMTELQKAAHEYGTIMFDGTQKEKSKVVFDFMVRIFNDTTPQYYEFYPELKKKKIPSVGINTPNQKVNQTDNKGFKQGFWTKVYPNGSKAYEVYFKDNVPVGEYKRYHENGKLAIFLNYDENGEWADAKIFDESGNLIGEGKYHGRFKHGHWKYYQENKLVLEDNYKEGNRDGFAKAYYRNGQVSDERNYTNNTENGIWRQYYQNGKKRLETKIENGKRNSAYYLYHENGRLQIRGKYTDDQMDGDWIYYDDQGKEIQKIEYVKGIAKNQKELNEKEDQFFKEMEKNKNRFLDPADFKHNPQEYFKLGGIKQF
jgi:antitoxin component YwqK of YwqJK toxin-antitoxin module